VVQGLDIRFLGEKRENKTTAKSKAMKSVGWPFMRCTPTRIRRKGRDGWVIPFGCGWRMRIETKADPLRG
jgi:hypothetical protein